MKLERFDPTNLPPDVCEHLSSKEIVCGLKPDLHPDLFYPGDDDIRASFWCELTQDGQGPDGEIVGFEFCRTHRTCCVSRVVPKPEA